LDANLIAVLTTVRIAAAFIAATWVAAAFVETAWIAATGITTTHITAAGITAARIWWRTGVVRRHCQDRANIARGWSGLPNRIVDAADRIAILHDARM
jgi:hypothetical protein